MELVIDISALPGTEDAAILDALLAFQLERSGFRLKFSPVLEADFERDTGPERCSSFMKYGVASLVLYDIFLFNYFTMLPDIAWTALFVQLCLITPLAFCNVAYTWRHPPAFWREATQVGIALLSLIAVILVYQSSEMPDAVFFRYSPVMTVLFINVVISVRFSFAVFASVIIVICNMFDLFCLAHATSDLKLLIGSCILWTCLFTLLANYRLEKQQRRAYLLNALDQLRVERVRHLAHHDGLTGLSNRTLLHERIGSALDVAGRQSETFALLCLDLDRFKAVNDTLGHAAGDLLLQQVAARLRQVTRAAEVAARIGGDEFVVLQTSAHQPQAAVGLATRLVEALAVPFSLNGQVVNIGTSVGVALFPQHGRSIAELLLAADIALYRAKKMGGCAYHFYEPVSEAPLHIQNLLEGSLGNERGISHITPAHQQDHPCHVKME